MRNIVSIQNMMKMMLKQFVPMIKEKLSGADGFVQELQQSDPLEPGEDEIVFMLTTDEGVAWIATVGSATQGIRSCRLIAAQASHSSRNAPYRSDMGVPD